MAVTAREKAWHGDKLKRRLESKLIVRLHAVATLLFTQLRKAVSKPYPPASRPGQPPHKRSGGLYDGIVVDANERKLQVNVGFKPEVEKQAMALEFGSRGMRPRPFIRPTLARLQKVILRMLKP